MARPPSLPTVSETRFVGALHFCRGVFWDLKVKSYHLQKYVASYVFEHLPNPQFFPGGVESIANCFLWDPSFGASVSSLQCTSVVHLLRIVHLFPILHLLPIVHLLYVLPIVHLLQCVSYRSSALCASYRSSALCASYRSPVSYNLIVHILLCYFATSVLLLSYYTFLCVFSIVKFICVWKFKIYKNIVIV